MTTKVVRCAHILQKYGYRGKYFVACQKPGEFVIAYVMSILSLYFLTVAGFVYFFTYPEVDNDLWGHLFFGREIVRTGELPWRNMYSFTAADHPWINHEWLAEVVFWRVYSLLGSGGLILFKTGIAGSLLWILHRTIARQMPSYAARLLFLIWAMALLSPGFNVRPQIFTYGLFAILLLVLFRAEQKHAMLYWLPPLMALWANLHGGVVAGLGALVIFLVWRVARPPNGRSKVDVAFAIALSVLFLALNPYGLGLVHFLATDLLVERRISEWAPIPVLGFQFLTFKLTVLGFAVFSWRQRAWQRWDFWVALLAALFAFLHQRHTPLFPIAAASILVKGLDDMRLSTKTMLGGVYVNAVGRGLLAAGFAIAVYHLYALGRIHFEQGFRLVVNPLEYPVQAADFLQRNNFRGNLIVPFDWGEYLIWKLYPNVRVSIDGRYTTAYPMHVIKENWDWMEGRNNWRALIERYPSEIAITHRRHPITGLLRKDPEWVYIYSDPVCFVFLRKVASQQELHGRFSEKRLVQPRSSGLHFPG